MANYTIYICNAFSLSMLDRDQQIDALERGIGERKPLPIDNVISFVTAWKAAKAEFVSAVGHEDTARVFSRILKMEVPRNRVTVKLDRPDKMALVGQYVGPRLPEGATELPENAKIEWWVI